MPIIKTTAREGIGIEDLKDAIIEMHKKEEVKTEIITYGKEVEEHLEEFTEIIGKNIELPEKYNSRWIALKLIENDKEILKFYRNSCAVFGCSNSQL